MSHQPPPEGTHPDNRPSPAKTEAEIAEAKRRDKLQTVCHSHHVAGTEPPPNGKEKFLPSGR